MAVRASDARRASPRDGASAGNTGASSPDSSTVGSATGSAAGTTTGSATGASIAATGSLGAPTVPATNPAQHATAAAAVRARRSIFFCAVLTARYDCDQATTTRVPRPAQSQSHLAVDKRKLMQPYDIGRPKLLCH